MKQRKIKYEVACNGREAVDKWRVGGFHLVLVRIQTQPYIFANSFFLKDN
jgi:hypothetical protein